MSTEIVTTSQKASALNLMASKFTVEPDKLLKTLKATVFKGATDDELLALVVVANGYGLNPLLKEIYAFPAKGGGIVPVVSVDGWIRMTNDHPMMDGMEFVEIYDSSGKLAAITCRIWRKDRTRPISVTEHLAECRRNSEPWKMEHRMLRHKAMIQCARYAFGFSGIQDEDEANDTIARVTTGRVVTAATMKIENPYRETLADPPSPAPEPQSPAEAPPVEISDATERASLVGEIRASIKTAGITMSAFAGKVREAGLVAPGVQVIDAPIEDLRAIAPAIDDIVSGNYIPLA
jgi:phage recombination protein Bet